jgi:hypothetical protein
MISRQGCIRASCMVLGKEIEMGHNAGRGGGVEI